MSRARVKVALTWGERYADEQRASYRQRLRDAGLHPIDFNKPGRSLDDCAGLVLTGGVDIDPARYGAEPHRRTEQPNSPRDAFELTLLEEALQRDLPVLAICRGHQLLNVCLGGSLVQHIESGEHTSHGAPSRESRWHDVEVLPSTRLAEIAGTGRVRVNSRHHQAVTAETLAPSLMASAVSPDGLIEAVEGAGRWVMGVQWHPERQEPEEPNFSLISGRIFTALLPL